MNEEIVRTVIAINNRCIEQLHDENVGHVLSEIHHALTLLKQVAIVDPPFRAPVSCPTNIVQSSSPPTPRSLHGLQTNHHQCHHQSRMVNVRIKFQREEANIASQVSTPTFSTPIVACNRLLLFDAANQYETSPSMVQRQNQPEIVNDSVSTEDLHLICATLLYNMGLLFHLHATTYHRNPDTSFHSFFDIRASKIYELVIRLCYQSNIWNTHDPYQQHRSTLRIIQMMAYNNYGKTCYNFGNYITYHHCINVLQHQLVFVSRWNSHFNNGSDVSVERRVISELRLNVLVAKLFPVPTLASAA